MREMKRTIKLYKMDELLSHYKTWQEAFQEIRLFGRHYSYDGDTEAKFYIDDKYFYYTPICNTVTSVDKDLLDDLINYYQGLNYAIEIQN